jgi:hypothetical protein
MLFLLFKNQVVGLSSRHFFTYSEPVSEPYYIEGSHPSIILVLAL